MSTVTARFSRRPFELTTADGWRLRGELVAPPEVRAVAVVGHAMMVDRRTLDRPPGAGVVSTLAAHGMAVVVADLRGHGRSGPRADAGADWSYDDFVDYDTPALLAHARATWPGLPVAAVGHSLFGHVALAYLARHDPRAVDKLVLLACNVANPSWRARPVAWVKKQIAVEVMAGTARLFGYVPVRRLRFGSNDEARTYARQFAQNGRRATWVSRDGFDYWSALPAVDVPTLALVGRGDRLYSPPADAAALAYRVRGARVEVVGRPLLPFDPGHMALVLDGRCRPVWTRAAQFILE